MSLSNTARPPTDATVTVRVIKSFTFRTEKSLVLHNLNLLTTHVGELKEITKQGLPFFLRVSSLYLPLYPAISTQSGWKPYRNALLGISYSFSQPMDRCHFSDTLKLYTKAHGSKVSPCSFCSYSTLTDCRPLISSSTSIMTIGY